MYFPKTQKIHDVSKLEIIPDQIPIPEVKMNDFLKQAAIDIISILQQPLSTTVILLKAGDPTRNALLDIASILKQKKYHQQC